MRKNRLGKFVVCVLLFGISFFSGIYYSSGNKEKESAIFFANIIGDHAVEINNIYSDLSSGEIKKKRDVYNSLFIFSIGCSSWLSSLENVPNQSLGDFLSGIDVALEFSLNSFDADDACLDSFLRWWNKRNNT